MSATTSRRCLFLVAAAVFGGCFALSQADAAAVSFAPRITGPMSHPAWVNNLGGGMNDMVRNDGPSGGHGGNANDWNLTHQPKPPCRHGVVGCK